VTDLFLSNVGRLGDSQIGRGRWRPRPLISAGEQRRDPAQRGPRQHPTGAPRQTIRQLAFTTAQVAAPVLRSSSCLSEADLLKSSKAVASSISGDLRPKTLNEALTDALMRFGDVNVSNALARNTGRVFPNAATRRCGRAERDEGLADKLGVRLDIPGSLLRELIGKVADVVPRAVLDGRATCRARKTQGSAAAAGQGGAARKAIDYTQAQARLLRSIAPAS